MGENGYEKRAGRVLVLLALCIIFCILPKSNTKTNLIGPMNLKRIG